MKVTKEISSFYELYEQCWSGAIDTLNTVRDNNKENELMNLLDNVFYDGVNETDLNDYLWFGYEKIFEILEIEEY